MKSFCSFLVVRPEQTRLVDSLCAKVGWNIRWIPDPSKRFRFHGSVMTTVSQPNAMSEFGNLRDGETYGQAMILEGSTADANNIIQLIGSAGTIQEGFPRQGGWPSQGFELKRKDEAEQAKFFEAVFQTSGYFEAFTFNSELPAAVALAVEAWGDRKIIYALHKLADSYRTESVTPWSMHPRHGVIFEKHSDEFGDHVTTSVAINLAFSAIEELGLEVRSSLKSPRWLDKEAFEWNPKVLSNIKTRLTKAGIDPNETIEWVARGDQTEAAIHPKRDSPAPYSDGGTVRDITLSLSDAISACGYLRNFMTAHAFGTETPLLGPYEVYNVQQVARFLILSKCGLWNVFTDDLNAKLVGT